MSIPLVGTGGLFARLGAIFGAANAALAPAATTGPAHAASIGAQYDAADEALIAGLYPALAAYQASPSAYLGQLAALAKSTVVAMAADDAPQPDGTLGTALSYLIGQMTAAGQSVARPAVTATPSAVLGNSGDAHAVATTLLRDGHAAENALAESLALVVTGDAQAGATAVGREALSCRGLPPVAPLGWTWPGGSGTGLGLAAVSAAQYRGGGAGNWLYGGDFELPWVTNLPPGWSADVGTAGTAIVRSTSLVYDGAASLSFVGDGAGLTAVSQAFGSPAGATASLAPLTSYLAHLWANTSGSPASGVLEVALVDGAGNITADAQGTPNATTLALAGVSGWTPVSASFRTPRVLPAVLRLRLRLSTALPAGTSVALDRVAFARPTQLYPQGPALAVFSGVAPLIAGDAFTVAVSNDRAGDAATCWQAWFDRVFAMRPLGLLLPSSASPTIPSSLIA